MQSIRPAIFMLSLVALCLLPFVEEANAVFKVNEPASIATQPYQAATLQTPQVVSSIPFVVETGSTTTERINSVGSDLPLNIALGRILPAGWQIKDDLQNPLLFKRVSWDISQQTLSQALTTIGQQENVRFFVNGDKKQVTVLPVKVASRTVQAPAPVPPPVRASAAPPKKQAAPNPEISEDVYKQPVMSVVWKLEPGSMREQLEKWCMKNNWTMAWTASLDDYIIPVSATFEGEFKEIVYEAFQVLRRTAGCGVKPKFYKGNNVVEVRDI